MAINFFEPGCTQQTNETIFGVIDLPPATLRFDDMDSWNASVDNEKGLDITFTAIDGCLNIPDFEGERCEAMMTYVDAILFIELKDRDGGRWAGKARDQLENTIALFKRDVGLNGYVRRYAHIANKQRPHFYAGGKNFSQTFEDDTGFILRVNDVIEIR